MAAWKDGELGFKIIRTLALGPRVVAAQGMATVDVLRDCDLGDAFGRRFGLPARKASERRYRGYAVCYWSRTATVLIP